MPIRTKSGTSPKLNWAWPIFLPGGLLKDAVLRSLNVASQVGARVLVVHALSDQAAAFYRHHGFQASPVEANTLMLPLTLGGLSDRLAGGG